MAHSELYIFLGECKQARGPLFRSLFLGRQCNLLYFFLSAVIKKVVIAAGELQHLIILQFTVNNFPRTFAPGNVDFNI